MAEEHRASPEALINVALASQNNWADFRHGGWEVDDEPIPPPLPFVFPADILQRIQADSAQNLRAKVVGAARSAAGTASALEEEDVTLNVEPLINIAVHTHDAGLDAEDMGQKMFGGDVAA